MITYESLTPKLQSLPSPLLCEVELFVDYLLMRVRQNPQIAQKNDEWMLNPLIMAGGAFDWLNDPVENDIYSDADGESV